MIDVAEQFVWVFTGPNAPFPAGVFSSREKAEDWIEGARLSGLLTAYPLDAGAYNWAVEHGYFTPKRPEQSSPTFISRFTSARMPHIHYEDGHPIE